MKITFEIITPDRQVLSEQISQVTVPTKSGQITILPGHIPLVAALASGEIRAKKNGDEILLAVSGGFLEVLKNKVVVLADTAERPEEIDEERAEKAIEKAKKLMSQKKFDQKRFVTFQAKIEKELARLKVARRRRH